MWSYLLLDSHSLDYSLWDGKKSYYWEFLSIYVGQLLDQPEENKNPGKTQKHVNEEKSKEKEDLTCVMCLGDGWLSPLRSVWTESEEKKLLGSAARSCYQQITSVIVSVLSLQLNLQQTVRLKNQTKLFRPEFVWAYSCWWRLNRWTWWICNKK